MAEAAHAALGSVMQSGQLATGARVAAFEKACADWLDVASVVALSDASAGLTLALYLAGVRPGDEVIASPLACAASLMPMANLFAKPVWCDVDPETGMMDPASVDALVSERTRALLIYHWSGDVANLDALTHVAKRRGLLCIQDATEALGARYKGRRLGQETDFTVYSFYATKPITTGGEGGILIAKNPEAAAQARRLRRFGIDPSTLRTKQGDLNPDVCIKVPGFNFAMHELSATIGLEQLRHLDKIIERHQENGLFYDEALQGIPGVFTSRRELHTQSAYWTYSLRVDRRAALIAKLHTQGITAQRLHVRADNYGCFSQAPQEFKGLKQWDAQTISLPCGWWVSDEDRQRIVRCLREGW